MPRLNNHNILRVLACAAALFALAACTAVVVDDPYARNRAPAPVIVTPAPGPRPVDPGPSRQRVNRRLAVCNTNYNNCMANCNAFVDAAQKALCINQCNAAVQQCRAQSTQ